MLPSEYIEKGWTQNRLYNPIDDEWCLVGAGYESVREETISSALRHDLEIELYNLIYAHELNKMNFFQKIIYKIFPIMLPDHCVYIDKWNDHRSRTKAEVLYIIQQAERLVGIKKPKQQTKHNQTTALRQQPAPVSPANPTVPSAPAKPAIPIGPVDPTNLAVPIAPVDPVEELINRGLFHTVISRIVSHAPERVRYQHHLK